VGNSGRERKNASISVVHRPLNVFASNVERRKWGRGQVLSDTAVPGTSVVQTDVSIHLLYPLAPQPPPFSGRGWFDGVDGILALAFFVRGWRFGSGGRRFRF